MKLNFVIYFLTFVSSIARVQKSEARGSIKIKDLRNDHTCQEDLFTLDDSYRKNNSKTRRELRSETVIDCFGVGKKLSSALDWFLRNKANGTSAQKINFYAMNRNLPEPKVLNHGERFDLDGVGFDATKRTVFIVHGFLSSGSDKWLNDMGKVLLKWGDMNVFIIDWSDGANTWNYYKAAVNTRTVGDQIATFIGQLVESTANDIDPTEFGPLHLIGHSLGSHICGYAAHELTRRASKWTVHRITGLDPAQPCFRNPDNLLKLDVDDAPFVDIIHTNGRVLTKLGLGVPYPIGHTDFYPNGGKLQPGCNVTKSSFWNLLPLPVKSITQTICSHGRAHLYFIDSVVSAINKDCKFWAHEWDLTLNSVDKIMETECTSRNCIEMGINSEHYRLNGTFLTITGKSMPYCLIDENTKKEVKDIMESVKRKLHCEEYAESREEIMVAYS